MEEPSIDYSDASINISKGFEQLAWQELGLFTTIILAFQRPTIAQAPELMIVII